MTQVLPIRWKGESARNCWDIFPSFLFCLSLLCLHVTPLPTTRILNLRTKVENTQVEGRRTLHPWPSPGARESGNAGPHLFQDLPFQHMILKGPSDHDIGCGIKYLIIFKSRNHKSEKFYCCAWRSHKSHVLKISLWKITSNNNNCDITMTVMCQVQCYLFYISSHLFLLWIL